MRASEEYKQILNELISSSEVSEEAKRIFAVMRDNGIPCCSCCSGDETALDVLKELKSLYIKA